MPYEPPAAAAQLHCEGTPPNSSWGIDEGEGLGPQGLKGVGWAACQVFNVLLMGQCQGLALPAGKWTQGHWSPG